MMKASRHRYIMASMHTPSRGFTLTELMIAIAVLLGVLLAVSRIFSTTSQVTSIGKATADVLQEAAAIERQIREDFANLSYDGVLAIRCVAVPNDINGALLNPSLPPTAIIRSDQIVFFADGVQSVQTFKLGGDSYHRGQGTTSRIYYGHAYQLGDGGSSALEKGNMWYTVDPIAFNDPDPPLCPWYVGNWYGRETKFEPNRSITDYPEDTDMFFDGFGTSVNMSVSRHDARRWIFARQPVILADDDNYARNTNAKTLYLGEVLTGRSIFLDDYDPAIGGNTLQIYHGRVDAASSQLNDIRRMIQYEVESGTVPPPFRPWNNITAPNKDQKTRIAEGLLYYPRAERYAPSMSRLDQALTNNVLGSACSEVKIDWTWDDGTGHAYSGGGDGLWIDASAQQPWFGMPDPGLFLGGGDNILPDLDRGVGAYGDDDYRDAVRYGWAETILPQEFDSNDHTNIEHVYVDGRIVVYEAVFGYNQDTMLTWNASTEKWEPDQALGYTPWPSAIRITLTLHDPGTTLETGREVQFVIRLPERPNS